MANKANSDRASERRIAISRDIGATVSRLHGDEAADDVGVQDAIVAALLAATELSDRDADAIWTQVPVDEVDEDELLAAARDVASRAQLQERGTRTTSREKASEGARVARRLRGPRHPFE